MSTMFPSTGLSTESHIDSQFQAALQQEGALLTDTAVEKLRTMVAMFVSRLICVCQRIAVGSRLIHSLGL